MSFYDKIEGAGEVSEWLKEHAWKACRVARLSQVRILFSPPVHKKQPLWVVFLLQFDVSREPIAKAVGALIGGEIGIRFGVEPGN